MFLYIIICITGFTTNDSTYCKLLVLAKHLRFPACYWNVQGIFVMFLFGSQKNNLMGTVWNRNRMVAFAQVTIFFIFILSKTRVTFNHINNNRSGLNILFFLITM